MENLFVKFILGETFKAVIWKEVLEQLNERNYELRWM
jgi:hypothetical protein